MGDKEDVLRVPRLGLHVELLPQQTAILTVVTVRRVGSAPEEAGHHHINLGRVLVTIDDLAALMTLVKGPDEPQLQIKFDNGYFTEAEELRTLTDMEMRSLRLKTSKVEVTLSPSLALAIGEQQAVEDVYQFWAEKRRTLLRPRPIQLFDAIAYHSALMGLTGLLGLSIIISQFNKPVSTAREYIIIGVASLFSILASVFMWRDLRANKSSYAIIIPLSRDEHRQLSANQKYPRRSWIVAIFSAVIAAVAVGVAIWAVFSR